MSVRTRTWVILYALLVGDFARYHTGAEWSQKLKAVDEDNIYRRDGERIVPHIYDRDRRSRTSENKPAPSITEVSSQGFNGRRRKVMMAGKEINEVVSVNRRAPSISYNEQPLNSIHGINYDIATCRRLVTRQRTV